MRVNTTAWRASTGGRNGKEGKGGEAGATSITGHFLQRQTSPPNNAPLEMHYISFNKLLHTLPPSSPVPRTSASLAGALRVCSSHGVNTKDDDLSLDDHAGSVVICRVRTAAIYPFNWPGFRFSFCLVFRRQKLPRELSNLTSSTTVSWSDVAPKLPVTRDPSSAANYSSWQWYRTNARKYL